MRIKRIESGPFGSSPAYGHNGAFNVRLYLGVLALVVISDEIGWEHVSVSLPGKDRCPTWEEMCEVKDLFFDEEETVVQYHPKKSEHVNNHKFCLHLWRPTMEVMPSPNSMLVGLRTK